MNFFDYLFFLFTLVAAFLVMVGYWNIDTKNDPWDRLVVIGGLVSLAFEFIG